jgi:hypothetical protein
MDGKCAAMMILSALATLDDCSVMESQGCSAVLQTGVIGCVHWSAMEFTKVVDGFREEDFTFDSLMG